MTNRIIQSAPLFLVCVAAIASCSDDRPTKSGVETHSQSSHEAKKGVPGPFVGQTRSASETESFEYAGFGRVGRSLYDALDYRARWAIIIGVNSFDHLPQLQNAANDARAFRDVLRDEFGYDESRILYLNDQDDEGGGSISKEDILSLFDRLAEKDVRSNDAVVFFFAGHGESNADSVYLAGCDARQDDMTTWIDAGQLKDQLRHLPARHKLVVLDSCYAGSLLEVDLSQPASTVAPRVSAVTSPAPTPGHLTRSSGDEAMELRNNLAYYLAEPAFMAMTSGRDETVSDGAQHSPFTSALLRVLKERANSTRKDDVFTARELAVRVESLVRGQTPDWGRLGIGRGDFIFRPTRDRLTPRELAERDNYAVRITLAAIELERGHTAYARQLLESCPAHLRHFEWYRLNGMMNQSVAVMPHPNKDAWDVPIALSPDGNLVVIGGQHLSIDPMTNQLVFGGGRMDFWRVGQAGQPIREIHAHKKTTSAFAFSKDRKMLASASENDTILIWDALKLDKPIAKLTGFDGFIFAMDFSPDGQHIVGCGWQNDRARLKVWDAQRGGNPLMELDGHGSRVQCVRYSPDGKWIVSGGDDRTIKIWDAKKGGDAVRTLEGHKGFVTSVAIDSQSEIVVSGSVDQTAKIWDLRNGGEAIETLRGHQDVLAGVVIGANRDFIATASFDKTIRVWKRNTPVRILRGHEHPLSFLGITPENKLVSGDRSGAIRVWDGDDEGSESTFPNYNGDFDTFKLSTDGKRFASVDLDGKTKIWDANNLSKPLISLPSQNEGRIFSLAFSRDGRRIVTGNLEGVVKLWDAERGGEPIKVFAAHNHWVRSVAISHDNRWIVSSGDDRITKIWNVATGESTIVIEDGADCIQFTKDGRQLVMSNSQQINIWEAKPNGKHLLKLTNKDSNGDVLAISDDGRRIVSVGDLTMLRVWDTESGDKPVMVLRGHDHRVTGADFSADGKRIVSVSYDRTVKVWDAERGGPPLLSWEAHPDIIWDVAFSPDGKRVYSAASDRTVRIWRSKGWPSSRTAVTR